MLETSWRGSAQFVDTVDDSEIGNSSTNSTDKEGANVLNSPFQHIINALSLWENVERGIISCYFVFGVRHER